MSATGLLTLVFIGLIVLKATSREVGAAPAPDIDSVSPMKSTHSPTDDKAFSSSAKLASIEQLQQAPSAFSPTSGQQQLLNKQQQVKSIQSNGEKLRRGLSNFLNNLNQASYFIPAPPPMTREQQQQSLANLRKQQQQPATAGSQAEPATIINIDGPTANALIKGPNRLAAPLRWGRK